jgi:hypothetical protein
VDSAAGVTASLQLGFADGSIGTIGNFANGSRAFARQGRLAKVDLQIRAV